MTFCTGDSLQAFVLFCFFHSLSFYNKSTFAKAPFERRLRQLCLALFWWGHSVTLSVWLDPCGPKPLNSSLPLPFVILSAGNSKHTCKHTHAWMSRHKHKAPRRATPFSANWLCLDCRRWVKETRSTPSVRQSIHSNTSLGKHSVYCFTAITNRLAYSCHENRKKLLQAALKSPRRQRRYTGSNREPCYC